MRSADGEEAFADFAASAITRLRPLAHATARDPHRADDLVQITLEKMYVAWPRIHAQAADPMAYARTVLVRSLISQRRRASWEREVLTDGFADEIFAVDEDLGREVSSRLSLIDALRRLPPRQRMAVVLRHLEGLSVDDVAELMDCSAGTVKSCTSAGLASLRHLLPDDFRIEVP